MQVLEYTLRVSGDAILEGDFKSFKSIFDLPHHITTFEGSRMLRTLDDLRETFQTVHNHCRDRQITNIVRECISAEFDEDHQIKSAHTTRLLAGSQQIGQTSMAYGVLRLKGGLWVSTSSQYALADDRLSKAMIVSSGPAVNENYDPCQDANGPHETK